MTESTEQTTPTNGGGLASLKLAQLQALASQLGIAGGSRMRKADLVTAISDHQRGGSVADRDAAERAAQAPAAPEAPATDGAVVSDIDHEVSGIGTGPVVLPDHQGAAPAPAPVVAADTSADPPRDRARPAPVVAPGEGPVASSSSEARSQGLLADRGGPSATLGLGLLGGAGALALVEARRRRQRRTRPPGWRVVVPTGAAARAEQWLRATTDVAGHADLDAALTMLAERCGATLPALRAARLGELRHCHAGEGRGLVRLHVPDPRALLAPEPDG